MISTDIVTCIKNLITSYTTTVDICNKDFLFYLYSALMQTFGALLAIIIAAWTFFIRNKLEIFESNSEVYGYKYVRSIEKGQIDKAFEINYKHKNEEQNTWTIDNHIEELLYKKLLDNEKIRNDMCQFNEKYIQGIAEKNISEKDIKEYLINQLTNDKIMGTFNNSEENQKHIFHKHEILISLILKSDFSKLHNTYNNYLEFLKIAIWVIGISTLGLVFAKFFIPMGYLVSVLSIILSIIGLWKLYVFIKEIL